MKVLLALKADYKNQTGQDYKPGAAPAKAQTAETPKAETGGVDDLVGKITAQGDQVKTLKSNKASKVESSQSVSLVHSSSYVVTILFYEGVYKTMMKFFIVCFSCTFFILCRTILFL